MKESEDEIKESIKQLLENLNITKCRARIDLCENHVKIEFSATFKDFPATNVEMETSRDMFPSNVHNEIDQTLTSGITPAEREIMEEQFRTFRDERSLVTFRDFACRKEAV